MVQPNPHCFSQGRDSTLVKQAASTPKQIASFSSATILQSRFFVAFKIVQISNGNEIEGKKTTASKNIGNCSIDSSCPRIFKVSAQGHYFDHFLADGSSFNQIQGRKSEINKTKYAYRVGIP